MDSLKKYNVLVVDDSASWQSHLGQVLEDYNVTVVGGAREALEALALNSDNPFHVAIVDKSLIEAKRDDESGLDLAREIKSIVADCQIIILTGYEDFESARKAFKNLQVFDFLKKFPEGGFDNEYLRKTVLRAILAAPRPDRSEKPKATQTRRPKAVTILHLSDLHFGRNHRFVRNKHYPRGDVPSLQKALIASIEASGKQPDIVVVSGDLTERGDFREFQQALKFLKTLSKHFNLETQRFIVVPGNHDVRWGENDIDDFDSEERDNLAEYRGFYELLYRQAAIEQAPLDRVELYEFKDKPDVAIVGFDSCVIEDSRTGGVGYVGITQLNNALGKLKGKIRDNVDSVKVAVLHHHLIPVAYLEKLPTKGKNFSLVVDATRILSRLQEEGFTLILHGHQHQPFCAELRFPLARTQSPKPMAIIGMGSAGINPELTGDTRNNHYGILEISKISPEAASIVNVSWYRAAANEPEEAFEIYQEFTLTL